MSPHPSARVGSESYRVTDADIDALRAAGHSDDEIFELTVSAAVGAARVRLERGLAALGKPSDAPR